MLSTAKTITRKLVLLASLMLVCAPAFAAEETPAASAPVAASTSEKIKEIVVVGNKKIEKDAVVEKLTSKIGQTISNESVRADILAIHKLNFFDSVKAEFDAGVLTYTVKGRPSISQINFWGNDQVSTDDLKGVVTIKNYDLYDENQVRDSVRKLNKYYEDKGYYLAKIDYEVRFNKEHDAVALTFRVREYDKVKIKKITFLGNKAFTDEQLKRVMHNTAEGGFFSWLTSSGNFKELDFKNDLQVLQYWYLNEGYVRFKYDPPVVSVSEDKKWVYITIHVDEGKKYHMSTMDFSGDLLFSKEELHNTLTLKEGDVFSISKRNADILALTEKYQDLGYANVNVVPNVDIDDANLLVATNFEFEKGTLVHFGRITIKGNTKTRDKVVRRELKIREGELYSGTGMRVSKENVERLGFFEGGKVEFNTSSPPGRPDISDVEISVKERPTGQFQLGAGYATTTKFFFTTQVAETNFMGRGQDLRFQGQLSADSLQRSASVSFTDPYAWDSLWSVGGDIYDSVTPVFNKYTEFRKGTGIRVGHPIFTDHTRLFVAYKLEQLSLSQIIDPLVLQNETTEDGVLSSVSVSIQNDLRNNRLETTGGHYESLSEEFAGIGGSRQFLRTIMDLRYYKKIVGDLTFRSKAEFGDIFQYSNRTTPSGEKFYLGGSNNLRGYESFSIGPTYSLGGVSYVAGGLIESFAMAELEYPIVADVGLKVVLFYDAGDAYDRFSQLSTKQDYGWGFRWFSPLGPLRFEWGYPFGRNSPGGSQFNFMIGPPF